jgi:hypothetical protein
MKYRTIMRASLILLIGMLSVLSTAKAQNADEPSVAEAARRAREKKNTAAKPAVVVTNDTLPAAPVPSATAQPESATTDAAGAPAPAGGEQPAPGGAAQGAAEAADKKKAELEALKRQVAEKQNEVDLQQRQLTLDQDAYYSKPSFSEDKAGKAKLTTMQDDLKQKQAELAALKAKLAELGPEDSGKSEPVKP